MAGIWHFHAELSVPQSHPNHEPFLDFCPSVGHHMVSWDTSLPAATSTSSLALMLLMTLRLLRFPDVPVVPKNPLYVSTTMELSPLTDQWWEMLRSSGGLRHVGHSFPTGHTLVHTIPSSQKQGRLMDSA